MKTLLNTLISVIVICLILSLWGFYSAIRPFKITNSTTPKKLGVDYEDISFKTQDNILIRGWFVKNSNPQAKTIILLHGYPADKGDIVASTIFLHTKYNLLYFDFRYLGQSGGHYSTIGKNEILDLLAAIKYLRTRNINEVGVWGFSLGGAVALMTAPIAPEIKAVAAESSYARLDWMAYDYYRIPLVKYILGELTRLWGILFLQYDIKDISPARAAEKIIVPVLLIHSTNDQVVSYDHAVLLQKAIKSLPNKEVIVVDSAHGQHFADYDKTIKKFFEKNLTAQTPIK